MRPATAARVRGCRVVSHVASKVPERDPDALAYTRQPWRCSRILRENSPRFAPAAYSVASRVEVGGLSPLATPARSNHEADHAYRQQQNLSDIHVPPTLVLYLPAKRKPPRTCAASGIAGDDE